MRGLGPCGISGKASARILLRIHGRGFFLLRAHNAQLQCVGDGSNGARGRDGILGCGVLFDLRSRCSGHSHRAVLRRNRETSLHWDHAAFLRYARDRAHYGAFSFRAAGPVRCCKSSPIQIMKQSQSFAITWPHSFWTDAASFVFGGIMIKKLTLAFVIALVPFAALAASGLKGKWLTDEGKGHVVFEDCGPKICGKIVWLKEPNDAAGKPLVDALNEETSLRGRPIIGLKHTALYSDGNGGWIWTH